MPNSTSAQQTADPKTDQAAPTRIQEQLKAPELAPPVQEKTEVKEPRPVKAPPGAENVKFTMKRVEFNGMTVYSPEDIKALYADKLNKTVTLVDVYALAQDLTRQYRKDGYVLTQVVVPPQTINKGVAKLRVVEGFIDQITVEGADDAEEEKLIKAYASRVLRGNAMNNKNLEHALLLINDLPGVTARSFLSPSKNKTGAADLNIKVEHSRYDGSIGVNNYGTRFLGPLQMDGAAAFNTLLGNNERVTLRTAMAYEDDRFAELFYISASYQQPVGTAGTMVSLTGTNTNTEPGFTLDATDVKGRSQGLSLRLDHPFVRSREFNWRGNVSFDYTNVDSEDNLGFTPTKDRLRVARVGTQVDGLDSLWGGGYNSVSCTISRGLDVFNANDDGQTNVTRPAAADPEFIKMDIEFLRQQRVNNALTMLMGVKAQWSDGPLLSSEEFGIGGLGYGRGYDNSEVVGDEGVAAKLELQWRDPVKFSWVEGYQAYAFYDIGRIWNNDASKPLEKQTLTSYGWGVRADVSEFVSANFLMAVPNNKTPATQDNQSPRVYFGVTKKF